MKTRWSTFAEGREEIDPLREELGSVERELEGIAEGQRTDVARRLADHLAHVSRVRLDLLDLVGAARRGRVVGLGAESVREAQAEGRLMAQLVEHGALTLEGRARTFFTELTVSPVPALVGLFQLMLLVLVWRVINRWVRQTLLAWEDETVDGSARKTKLAPYIGSVRRPAMWLALLTLLLRLPPLSEMPGVDAAWMAVLWILGTRIVIGLLNVHFSSRRRSSRQRDAMRLRSLRLAGTWVATVGTILSVTAAIVGQGAIYAWVVRICFALAVPIVLLIVMWWKPYLWEDLDAKQAPEGILASLRARKRNLVWTMVLAVHTVWTLLARFAIGLVSRLDATRHFRAHLLRRQVAVRRAAEDGSKLTPVNALVLKRLDPARPAEKTLEMGIECVDELLALPARSTAVVIAERGGGKSTVLARVAHQAAGEVIALRTASTAADVEKHVRDKCGASASLEGTTVLLDDAHRLVRPCIGGLDEFDAILMLAEQLGGRWVLAMDSWSWQFVERARDTSGLDAVVRLPAWGAGEIASLIGERTTLADLSPNYDDLVLPRRVGEDHDPTERPKVYHSMIGDVSDGNPGLSLQLWRQSLFTTESETVVRLFREPDERELEGIPQALRFVLRCVLQLDLATEADIFECTDMPDEVVCEALRVAMSRGYIVREAGELRISWSWYRPVRSTLTRLNLLVAP